MAHYFVDSVLIVTYATRYLGAPLLSHRATLAKQLDVILQFSGINS